MRDWLRATSIATILLAAATFNGRAQPLLSAIAPMGDPIAAVDSEYARAVIQSVAQILATDTDASCREAQALTEDRLASRLRDIFIVHGTMWNAYNGVAMNGPEFARAFAAGQRTLAEWALLLRQPVIEKLVAMQAPLRNDEMIHEVALAMHRFLYIRRAPHTITREFDRLFLTSPDADRLDRARERDKGGADKAVSEFLQSTKDDPQVARYLELSEVHARALSEAHEAVTPGIAEIFPGIGSRLKALCVPIDP